MHSVEAMENKRRLTSEDKELGVLLVVEIAGRHVE